MPIWLIIIIVIVVLILLWFFGTYNGLVSLRNKVKDQWAQIDVQLKRRADLIPNLVETVKGYAKHEKGTLEDVIKARNTFVSAKTPEEEMKAAGDLEKTVSKLFALAESYPELKANENFISLQNDLKDTEDKISYARQFYNDAVRVYNDKVQMVPSNIVASICGFAKEAFFEAIGEDREAPKVSFDDVKEDIKEKVEDVKDKAEDFKEDVKDKAADIKEDIEDKAEDIKEDISDKAEDIKEGIEDVVEDVKKEVKPKAKKGKK